MGWGWMIKSTGYLATRISVIDALLTVPYLAGLGSMAGAKVHATLFSA